MPVNSPGPSLLDALKERVVVADGAMGTMLQAADLSIDDFAGLEGCNEILNVTRPDVVRGVHDAYFRAGSGSSRRPARHWPRTSLLTGPRRIGRVGFSDRSGRGRSCRRSVTCVMRF